MYDLILMLGGGAAAACGSVVLLSRRWGAVIERSVRRLSAVLLIAGLAALGAGLWVWHVRERVEATRAVCGFVAPTLAVVGGVVIVLWLVARIVLARRGAVQIALLSRLRVLVLGCVCLLTAYVGLVLPRMETDGWMGALPTTYLIARLESLPERWLYESDARSRMPMEDLRNPGDWTLTGRVADRGLWRWQEDWLRGSLMLVVSSQPTVPGLKLCMAMERRTGMPDRDLIGQYIFRGFVSDDGAVRAEMARQIYAIIPGGKSAYQWAGRGWVDRNRVWLAPKLMDLAGSPDEEIAEAAIHTLSFCASEAMPFLPRLLREVEGESPSLSPLKYASANALRLLSEESPGVQDWLMRALPGASTPARRAIAEILQSLSWNSKRNESVVGALRQLCNDPDPAVAQMAREAVGQATSP